MKIEIELDLLNALLDGIEKQAIMHQQQPETQLQWKNRINEAYIMAHRLVTQQIAGASGQSAQPSAPAERRTEVGMGPILNLSATPYI